MSPASSHGSDESFGPRRRDIHIIVSDAVTIPPQGILTYYLYGENHTISRKSESLYPKVPRPLKGTRSARGADSYKKKRFSSENRHEPSEHE